MSSKNIVHIPQGEKSDKVDMNFGDVIVKYRKKENLTQTELAEMLNTTRRTLTNWENGKNMPDINAIRLLAQTLGIPLYELFGIKNNSLPSKEETVMLEQFRQLSPVGQRVIDQTISTMLKEEETEHYRYLQEEHCILPLQSTPVAAGVGCEEVQCPAEPFFVKRNRKSERADAIFRVSGDSMEPRYHNGDLVYVKHADSGDDGDDVVCVYHEGFIIKNFQGGKLYSLNKKRDFGMNHENDDIKLLGKVLGIVEKDEIPDADDSSELTDIFQKELRKFEKEHGSY